MTFKKQREPVSEFKIQMSAEYSVSDLKTCDMRKEGKGRLTHRASTMEKSSVVKTAKLHMKTRIASNSLKRIVPLVK